MPPLLKIPAFLICSGMSFCLFIVNVAHACDDCIFDKDYFSKDRYENEDKVDRVAWNDSDDSVGMLLTNGALISVKHWSCDHLGIEAKQYVHPYSRSGDYNIRDAILLLGQIVLDTPDYLYLQKAIETVEQSGELPVRIDITGATYSEFFVAIEVVSDSLIITIKYYRD